MRTERTLSVFAVLFGSLVLSALPGCGDDEQPPEPEPSECDRYQTCDETGPFGDGDYERWGEGEGQGGEDPREGEEPPE